MTEGIWDTLPRSRDSEEEVSENLALEVVLSKLIFTLPSWNWVICFISVFGGVLSWICDIGSVALSKIQSSGSVIWFHCIGLGITTFALVISV